MKAMEHNLLINYDYPDPDVIRVGNVYYMVSTTMHFMPGCEILRSYDLLHWEHASYVYDRLDSTPGQRLEGEENVYGKGMWAATLRHHKEKFYIIFVANDTHKTYLFTSAQIDGPWEKREIEGFYHDCSLLFDDDDRVYLAYGNRTIYITELNADLSAPLPGGLHRIVVEDKDNPLLGYEGTHFYKINGKYYLFFIHSLKDRWRRVEACFAADSLTGEFTGGDVFNEDYGYCGQGVAQGGIVDTPDGTWYAVLFQDRGASGRMPVLVPVTWDGDAPVFGADGTMPAGGRNAYRPLAESDDFKVPEELRENKELYGCFGLKSMWQFNHEPDLSCVFHDKENGSLKIQTGKLCKNFLEARNVLTVRSSYPGCAGEVTVDGSSLKVGDYSGISTFLGTFGMAALTRKADGLYLVMRSREPEEYELPHSAEVFLKGTEREIVKCSSDTVRLKASVDFTMQKDEAEFFYDVGEGFQKIGITHKMRFTLDHFTGCRFGLFVYATEETGGSATFRDFRYIKKGELLE